MINKQYLLLLPLLFALLHCSVPETVEETTTEGRAWETISFEDANFSKTKIDSLDLFVNQGVYGNIDQILLIKQGKILFNKSYSNDYAVISRGKQGDLGCGIDVCSDTSNIDIYNYYHPKYHPYYLDTKLHSLQSVTKTVAATVIGLAIQRGDIPNVEVNLLDYFQDYDLSQVDEALESATLEDLLTMRLGIAWNEMTAPLDSTNLTMQLEKSEDWIQFTLNQVMDAKPGEKWVYNSGASHLMSHIIKKATGQSIQEYAEAHLFKPLGIEEYFWKTTPKGYADCEGGLYLRAEDLAKIGQLYLENGRWQDQQILSEEWIKASTSKQVKDLYGDGGEEGYGYQWWLSASDKAVWIGIGFGNQFLMVVPQYKVIGVVNAWNIFDQEGKYIFGDFQSILLNSNLD